MSDYDKNKDIRRKKFFSTQKDREYYGTYSNQRKGQTLYKYEKYDRDTREGDRGFVEKESVVPQPTILLKNREHSDRASSPKQSTNNAESEIPSSHPTNIQKPKPVVADLSSCLWSPPFMPHSVKLIDENLMFSDAAQEYLLDNSDFLVVGVLGNQGVGKSTILNLIAENNFTSIIKSKLFDITDNEIQTENKETNDLGTKFVTEALSSMIIDKDKRNCDTLQKKGDRSPHFKIQSMKEIEKGENCTSGIDIYVTSNRIILLDVEPILSLALLDKAVQTDNKATAAGEIILSAENSNEIQSLQLAAFVLSVCHTVLLVQDWFFNSNLIRFIQAAEMLKPSTTAGGEEEFNEHSPHLLLIHNFARMEDFSPAHFKTMQNVYKTVFNKSKLKKDSGMGLGTGNIVHSLSQVTCGEPMNVFLLPEITTDNEIKSQYRGHPSFETLVQKLKSQIQGVQRTPLTHAQLSEKTWLNYASRVWEAVKKSSFFLEYNKLLP